MISEPEYQRKYRLLLQAVDELVTTIYSYPFAFWYWIKPIKELTKTYEILVGDRYREG